ncbi:MAG: hypothetical protein WBR15_10915 [Gammaproteobacteria bacterium]
MQIYPGKFFVCHQHLAPISGATVEVVGIEKERVFFKSDHKYLDTWGFSCSRDRFEQDFAEVQP